jgi:Ca2+-binding EF-hand superfamily protein
MRFNVFTRCLVAAVAFAVFSPAAVMAQETKPKMDPEKVFKRRDANGDGSISEDEFLAAAKEDKQKETMKKRFGKIDSNGDGKLSLDEFKAGMVPPKKKQK